MLRTLPRAFGEPRLRAMKLPEISHKLGVGSQQGIEQLRTPHAPRE